MQVTSAFDLKAHYCNSFPSLHAVCALYVFVNVSNTERYKKSAVPFLQRLLNEDYLKQKNDLKNLLQVNNGVCYNTPIT